MSKKTKHNKPHVQHGRITPTPEEAKPDPAHDQRRALQEDGKVTTPPGIAVGAGHVASTAALSPPAIATPRAALKNPPQLVAVEREVRDPERRFLRREAPTHLVGTFKASPALVVDDVLSGLTGPIDDEGRWRVAAVRARTSACQVVVLVPADAKPNR